MSDERRSVLLAVDEQELAEFDRYWRAVGFASRRSAIRHCMQVAIAQHHASVQRGRADPGRWLSHDEGRPVHTPDRAPARPAAGGRPLTADLARELLG